MATGTVKFFNSEKRWGFIRPSNAAGGRECEVFFGERALAGCEVSEGDPVEYEAKDTPRGLRAMSVKPL